MHPLLPKCPDHFHKELSQKIERYTTAQWWIPTVAHQAVPMLCIPKKNGKLCTVFDLREQSDNTVKDMTPFPDQDIICYEMARVVYWSKLKHMNKYASYWNTSIRQCSQLSLAHSGAKWCRWVIAMHPLPLVTDDCHLLRLHQLICPCLPGQHLHIFVFHWGTWKTPWNHIPMVTRPSSFP